MASHPPVPGPRGARRGRRLRPCVLQLEERTVPSLTFPGIAGITIDSSGDVFVSYDSTTPFSGQQESVAEIGSNGFLASASVFSTSGPSAVPARWRQSARPRRSRGSVARARSSSSSRTGSSSTSIPRAGRRGRTTICRTTPRMRRTSTTCRRARRSTSPSQISLVGATYGDFGVYGRLARGLGGVERLGLCDAAGLRILGRAWPRCSRRRRPRARPRPPPAGSPSTRLERCLPPCRTCGPVPPRRSTWPSDSTCFTTPARARPRLSRCSA